MTFSSCEDCLRESGRHGTPASRARPIADEELTATSGRSHVRRSWVGFKDADGDDTRGWPAGCSSARRRRVHGGLCEYHVRDHCVTLNRNVARDLPESSQCCACSIPAPARN